MMHVGEKKIKDALTMLHPVGKTFADEYIVPGVFFAVQKELDCPDPPEMRAFIIEEVKKDRLWESPEFRAAFEELLKSTEGCWGKPLADSELEKITGIKGPEVEHGQTVCK